MPLPPALILSAIIAIGPQAAGDCSTPADCRTQALQAAEQHDYERFHDLAWRAVQKGKKNDTELMLMLARAQSLSGRPGDALVMLQRLAALGVPTDAATSEDFARVRALPGWAAFEAQLSGTPASATPATTPAPAASRGTAPATAARPSNTPAASSAAVPSSPSPAPPAAAPKAAIGDATEALRFSTLAFTPAGLAYDRVSNRFIVGDHDARKLTVVDEASQRVANLVGAQSGGFGSIGALEIDAHEGDLWVVSSPVGGRAGQDAPGSVPTLHKLQLISGRTLYDIPLDAALRPARFADVAVTPHSTILVLDAERRRVFVAEPKSRRLELAMSMDAQAPTSIAPASDDVAYVAHQGGVTRLELGARRARDLTAAAGITLSGLTRIRFHQGALLGVQQMGGGLYRIVRLKLDSGERRVTGVDVLDDGVRMTDPTAAALAGDVFYYLAAPAATTADSMRADTIVRRVTVK